MAENPEEPEQLVESVGSLDTARMTLRWALERIRSLEKTLQDNQQLLKEAALARERATTELDSLRGRVDERSKDLAAKERFVGEMQGLLNDLFRGEVSVADLVRRKQQVEDEAAALEAKVNKRLADAQAARDKDLREHARMLSDMEATYTGALADAQAKYHEETEGLRRRHELALREETEKLDRFKEDAAKEVQLQDEQYHQKLILLEREYGVKRRALQEDYDRLKAKLVDEQQTSAAVRDKTEAHLRAGWEADLERLRALADERARRVTALESHVADNEAKHHEKLQHRSHEEEARLNALRRDFEARQTELRRESDALRQKHMEELRAARAEQKAVELAFDEERGELLAAQRRLREDLHAEFERGARALAERGASERAADLKRLEAAHAERREHERAAAEADLDALRRYYEGELEKARRARSEDAQRQSLEFNDLRGKINHLQQALSVQRAEILQESNSLRAAEALRQQAVIDEMRRGFETAGQENLARARQQALTELEAVRSHFQQILRARDQDARALDEARSAEISAMRAALAAKLDEPSRVREEEIRKREEALSRLEAFFMEAQNRRSEDTAEQLEELRRRHKRAMETLRRESSERPRPAAAVLPEPKDSSWKSTLLTAVVSAMAGAAAVLYALRSTGY